MSYRWSFHNGDTDLANMTIILKKIIYLSVLLPVMFTCSCSGGYALPTFKPLDNTADMVLIDNTRWYANKSEIIAIDTKTSEVKQTYQFNAGFFKSFVRSAESNICYVSFLSSVVGLDTLTGRCIEIYNDPIWDNNIYNGKLYFTNDYNHTQTFCYDAKSGQLNEVKTYGAVSSAFIESNGSLYSVNYIGSAADNAVSNMNYTIYNFTKQYAISLEYDYCPLEMYCNKYLVSEHSAEGGVYLHEAVSFEPEDLRYITKLDVMPDCIAEDDEYIYIGGHWGNIRVIRKSDNQLTARSKPIPEFEGSGLTVIKDGYAWLGAGQCSGDFYRIETIDSDGDGILNWKLYRSE